MISVLPSLPGVVTSVEERGLRPVEQVVFHRGVRAYIGVEKSLPCGTIVRPQLVEEGVARETVQKGPYTAADDEPAKHRVEGGRIEKREGLARACGLRPSLHDPIAVSSPVLSAPPGLSLL